MARKKTPQQKKRESYEKDRRNVYGERGAKSRYAIAPRVRMGSMPAKVARKKAAKIRRST